MDYSKTQVDKAGRALSRETFPSADAWLEYEDIFNTYRARHLEPLTEVTMQLQQWLRDYGVNYYLAQRLKRKPQILRKLRRLSVRLTQLQDIGGCRIILEKNVDIDHLGDFLARQSLKSEVEILGGSDYREKGRDDSGYRALHLILRRSNTIIELQIRSKIQHYWAENVERTSVVYGHYLKEQQGDPAVLRYFKHLSDAFYEVEAGRKVAGKSKLSLSREREAAEAIIRASARGRVLDSFVNEGVIRTLLEREQRLHNGFNNWLLIFDWNLGSFVNCELAPREPLEASRAYREAEDRYADEDGGFEVVLIGSSDIATIRETHSHYFGVTADSELLERLDQSIVGFTKKMDLDIGAREILMALHTRRVWGDRSITRTVMKNHFCKKVLTFEASLDLLIERGLVIETSRGNTLLLNMQEKAQIERYI